MNRATRAFVSTFGAIMALAGIEHGIGEVLQGSVAPSGIMILSWPNSAFFRNVGGEPAMTVIPNLLVTGIVAILLSLALLAWTTLFVQRKHGGLVMVLIAVGMLLAGGGIFPPVLAILVAVVASRLHSRLTWWRGQLHPGVRQFLAGLWPWSFGACVTGWVLMFAGPAVAGYFFGAEVAELVWVFLLFALGTLVSTIVTGFAPRRTGGSGERRWSARASGIRRSERGRRYDRIGRIGKRDDHLLHIVVAVNQAGGAIRTRDILLGRQTLYP